MSKKLFKAVITIFLILTTLQVVMQPIKETKANPWFIFTQVPPLSGTIAPVINIISPKNNSAYASNTILFSFTVTGPQAPNNLPIGFRVIDYYLDDNYTVQEYCIRVNSSSTSAGPQYAYSANLTLPKGGHYIKVDATGVVFTGGLNLYDTNTSSVTVVFSTQPDASTTPFPISDANCIKIVSPQPVNYSSNGSAIDIPLIVSINGSFRWMHYFLGDTGWWPKPYNQMITRNVDITENTTLKDVPFGSYVLTVDINNTFTYATLIFNVTDSDPNALSPPTPCPSTMSTPSPSPNSTPTSTPPLTASLSESASALNFGNRVNFTVTAEGGTEPYTYAWYLDNQLAETSTSPYFATNNQAAGSHHMHVEVTDAENNTANTLTVEFNVLSIGSSSSPSPHQTQQPTIEPSPSTYNTQAEYRGQITIAFLVAVAVAVGLLVYFAIKKRGKY